MQDESDLSRVLARIDGRGYKAYVDIRGSWALAGCTLHVDFVQGDPFAAPSRLRLRVPAARAGLPANLMRSRIRRVALADHLARRVRDAIDATREDAANGDARAGHGRATGDPAQSARRGSGRSGLVFVDAGGQEVLERSAILLHDDWVEARIEVGLPATGRRVLGRQAERLLTRRLPEIARRALAYGPEDGESMRRFVECVENQEHIRSRLDELGLVAFVADGAILPRESGASERPMQRELARSFSSPPSMRVEIDLVNPIPTDEGERSRITGMGIGKGVTLIVGGGYHGKSTLLRALSSCVYAHVPGDGREYVVAAEGLVKIRAEDGRAVTGVDIHAFIDRLPRAPGDDPARSRTRPDAFSTTDASGSTSQAAAIVEAIEAGASGLLMDEDTSATNFMLRDARMQRLVHADHEPITPFVDRVGELRDRLAVSTVLVMGSCGDYFDVADRVVMMRDYQALDATEDARRIARAHSSGRSVETRGELRPVTPRVPLCESFAASRGRHSVRIAARSREQIDYGEQTVDVRALAQLLDTSQARAVGMAIHLASQRFMAGQGDAGGEVAAKLAEVLDRIEACLDEEGLDALDPFARERDDARHPGALARPRRYEIAAAINRMRGLRVVGSNEAPDPDKGKT